MFRRGHVKISCVEDGAWSHFDTPKIEIGFYNLQGPNESRFFINFFGCMKTDTEKKNSINHISGILLNIAQVKALSDSFL